VDFSNNRLKQVPHRWVTEVNVLNELSEGWLNQPALFIDTEFHREKTFYPQLALIQLYDGYQAYLIEPNVAKGNQLFINVLQQPTVTKVFHSASEDCEVLYRFLNVKLHTLWDTQVAAAYAGLGNSLGYGRLVQQLCGIELPKGHSRTDWMKRPLSDEQIRYAVDDVLYLAQIYQHSDLKRPDLEDWILQECQALAERVDELDDINKAYLDIKNAWTLDLTQLNRLYHLARWREIIARKKDIPKTFILRNDALVELAQKGLNSNQHLPKLDNFHPAARRRFAADIVNLLINLPPIPNDLELPLSPAFWNQLTEKMQQARSLVERVGQKLGINPEVLCSKKLLRGYVKYLLKKSSAKPRGWTQLKEEYLGDPLKSIFCDNK
jgi:ribonuclease D